MCLVKLTGLPHAQSLYIRITQIYNSILKAAKPTVRSAPPLAALAAVMTLQSSRRRSSSLFVLSAIVLVSTVLLLRGLSMLLLSLMVLELV